MSLPSLFRSWDHYTCGSCIILQKTITLIRTFADEIIDFPQRPTALHLLLHSAARCLSKQWTLIIRLGSFRSLIWGIHMW